MSILEFDWFDSGYGLLESACECDIEPPGSISHGVSNNVFIVLVKMLCLNVRRISSCQNMNNAIRYF